LTRLCPGPAVVQRPGPEGFGRLSTGGRLEAPPASTNPRDQPLAP